MATALNNEETNEEEQLGELYWANLPRIEQPMMPMDGYKPNRSEDCKHKISLVIWQVKNAIN